MNRIFILFTVVFTLVSCNTSKTAYYKNKLWASQDMEVEGKKPIETLFVVGDAGKLDGQSNYVLDALKEQLKETSDATLVYLGDNIYTNGMPSSKKKARGEAETILDAQLEMARYVDGDTYFIPGNHDWNDASKGGKRAIQRQEKYIESYYDETFSHKVRVYPSDACGDPKEVKVHKDLVYVFIDSQWWLQKWDREKEMNQGCDVKSRADFLKQLNEVIIDRKNDEIVIFLHHPIQSNGNHGGNYSLKQHLFPLTMLNNNFYLPLPVVGSLYPLYRKISGSKQDVQNAQNKRLMESITQMATAVKAKVTFISGHEHNLQYFDRGNQKLIISGSGAKKSFAKKGGGATYARSERGFARVDFYDHGESWVSFYTVSGHGATPKLDFKTQLRKPKAGSEKVMKTYTRVMEKDTMAAVNAGMKASGLKETFMGEQYRNIWTKPVTLPTIDLEAEGLTPVKLGGGMSSNSLRLQAEDGKQYILRSINKVFTRGMPDEFKNLRMIDIIRDQNSAYHPYGSLVVANLSEAADVYYTDPKVVFLKHQKALGSYNDYLPEEMYMYEQRPNGDWSGTGLFGDSKEVISYSDLLVRLREKKNHFIDQEWVLKSRLFDILIHDWDRHDDQWRWATFEEDGKNIYRPIPRDRDLAFYKFKGAIPWFISQFVITKYKTMKGDAKDLKSLTMNGKYFDRYFLNELEWEEWIPVIEELQARVTDEVIDDSGRDLPKEIRSLSDAELNDKLKSRRDNLKAIARRFYDLINTEVEVTGTDNKDIFNIVTNPDGSIHVSYEIKRKKKGNLKKYDRTFYPDETEVVRLYGLGEDDEFHFEGTGNSIIKISIIGGEGEDRVVNNSMRKDIAVYDDLEGVEIEGIAKDKTSSDISVNDYDRYGFMYDASLIAPQFHYNRDGLWFGAQYTKIINGWRGDPYKASHLFKFITAPSGQEAYRFDYIGHIPKAFGNLDFRPSVNVDFPKNNNFFGFGNETVDDAENRDFNWVRMNAIEATPLLSNTFNAGTFEAGPIFQSFDIYNIDDRIIKEEAYLDVANYERQYFGGLTASYEINAVDNNHNPQNGVNIHIAGSYLNDFKGDYDHFKLSTGLRFYLPLINNRLTLANQLGFEWLSGDAYFYQMPALGNKQGLRGLRGDRFIGDSAFYENVDLRLRVASWNNVILPMDIGLVGGYDIGRVWLDGEDSDRWHNSKSVGLYLDLLGMAIVQPIYSFTEDGNQLTILTRFSF